MAAGALSAATFALAGCGGGGSTGASPFQATISGYQAALVRRDAAAACAEITPTFWRAAASQFNTMLSTYGLSPVSGRTCVRGLRYVFSYVHRRTTQTSRTFSVNHVSVHGATAWATVTDGSKRLPARFVRSTDGHWKLDCCTGAQNAQLPTAHWRVPSTSMEPTLKPGEIVASDNSALRARTPSLGEIVIFHPPGAQGRDARPGEGSAQPCGTPAASASTDFGIKRVVGLPGDRIGLVAGRVVRNGVVEREPYILRCTAGTAQGCNFPRPIVIPPGSYYLLGDNRGDSLDSRFYGPIPRAWIVGLVTR
ncbi:MAG: signal peptidase I [Actinomycetota bacterium]|nr:signal peptidase I [Actinomycetota bacterium]